jgi:hypothetical protein
VKLGKLLATGFENDSTRVSDDPTELVGNAGVYRYNAGFRRHGATAILSNAHVAVRALYADATTRTPSASVSYAPAPDSGSVYATRYSSDGSDVLATEASLDFGAAALASCSGAKTDTTPAWPRRWTVAAAPDDVLRRETARFPPCGRATASCTSRSPERTAGEA